MAMRSFLVFILVLFAGVSQLYLFFQNHFSGADIYKSEVVKLESKLEEERTRSFTALFEAERIRQEVATLLPNKINDNSSYEVRKLASVLQAQESFDFGTPIKLLSEGKSLFSKSDYNKAIQIFRKLIARYPDSPETVEALFLTAEALFQIQSTEDCIDTVEQMVSQFPESELTGFAMLRLAVLFEQRQMEEDAIQVVQTVQQNFSYHQELREQSAHLLKDLKR